MCSFVFHHLQLQDTGQVSMATGALLRAWWVQEGVYSLPRTDCQLFSLSASPGFCISHAHCLVLSNHNSSCLADQKFCLDDGERSRKANDHISLDWTAGGGLSRICP